MHIATSHLKILLLLRVHTLRLSSTSCILEWQVVRAYATHTSAPVILYSIVSRMLFHTHRRNTHASCHTHKYACYFSLKQQKNSRSFSTNCTVVFYSTLRDVIRPTAAVVHNFLKVKKSFFLILLEYHTSHCGRGGGRCGLCCARRKERLFWQQLVPEHHSEHNTFCCCCKSISSTH